MRLDGEGRALEGIGEEKEARADQLSKGEERREQGEAGEARRAVDGGVVDGGGGEQVEEGAVGEDAEAQQRREQPQERGKRVRLQPLPVRHGVLRLAGSQHELQLGAPLGRVAARGGGQALEVALGQEAARRRRREEHRLRRIRTAASAAPAAPAHVDAAQVGVEEGGGGVKGACLGLGLCGACGGGGRARRIQRRRRRLVEHSQPRHRRDFGRRKEGQTVLVLLLLLAVAAAAAAANAVARAEGGGGCAAVLLRYSRRRPRERCELGRGLRQHGEQRVSPEGLA